MQGAECQRESQSLPTHASGCQDTCQSRYIQWRGGTGKRWGQGICGLGLGGRLAMPACTISKPPSWAEPPAWVKADLCQRYCWHRFKFTCCRCWGLPWSKRTNVPWFREVHQQQKKSLMGYSGSHAGTAESPQRCFDRIAPLGVLEVIQSTLLHPCTYSAQVTCYSNLMAYGRISGGIIARQSPS